MKIPVFFVVLLSITLTSCKTMNGQNADYPFSGRGMIKELGITTWQYGTHTIEIGQKTYALKSDNIDLNKFNNRVVTISGDKIKGYPVDGGPEYIDVKKVDE